MIELSIYLEEMTMLRLALVFLIVALVAALLGSGLVAGMAFEGAKILFVIFLILALVSAVMGYRGRATDL